MHTTSALLAFALVSLPTAATAKGRGLVRPVDARATAGTVAHGHAARRHHPSDPDPDHDAAAVPGHRLDAAVALTRQGVYADAAHTLVPGLEVVDQQTTDVDGDGDDDALWLVDVGPAAVEAKPGMGRGVVVVYREPGGYRAETVASVPLLPAEAGYNWGPVPARHTGASSPVLHVMFSRYDATAAVQRDTVVRFYAGQLRELDARETARATLTAARAASPTRDPVAARTPSAAPR